MTITYSMIKIAAADLQQSRNLVAHGRYSELVTYRKAENSPDPIVDVKMEASDTRDGKKISKIFDKSSLEDFYYKIAHLKGKIGCISTVELLESFEGTPEDIAFLQKFLVANHPNYLNVSL